MEARKKAKIHLREKITANKRRKQVMQEKDK